MSNEVFPGAEGFPTFFALKRFFSTVGPLMQDESRTMRKGPSTLGAHKRLLPSVDPLVPLEV